MLQRRRDARGDRRARLLVHAGVGARRRLLPKGLKLRLPRWRSKRAVEERLDAVELTNVDDDVIGIIATAGHRPGVCSKRPCPQVAEYAMLPSLRPPAEYYWQRSPTTLVGGKAAAAHELPPIDGLLAYWVGKYGGAM